ncbi:MAG: hypothetical protein ACJ8EH_11800 [Sphingomicrobium sp.]
MIDQDTSRSTDTSDTGDTSPRQRAIEAYVDARGRAVDTLGEAPLLALAGGLAAGALIAALLPRTDTESRLVRPTARRVRDTARAALDAARDTGTQRLDELGLNRSKGEETIRSLLDGLSDAARASANAAMDTVRNKG